MYQIEYKPAVERFLIKLKSNKLSEEILNAVDDLANNPRPDGVTKLKGSKKQIYYRIRINDYRIVYQIQDKQLIIMIMRIGHRKEIYKELKNLK